MTSMGRAHHALFLAVALMSGLVSLGCRHSRTERVLNCPVDSNTAIRFFYYAGEDYFHFPLILRPVGERDPRLNTAPMAEEGRTAYVTGREMQDLLQGLAHSGLRWEESEKVEPMESFKRIATVTDNEIRVVCSKGTAMAHFDPKRICETLKPLDSTLRTPRALWEFQLFREGYGCTVTGFNWQAYPDHSH